MGSGPENINYSVMEYVKEFYRSHTALTPEVAKINTFKMNGPWEQWTRTENWNSLGIKISGLD